MRWATSPIQIEEKAVEAAWKQTKPIENFSIWSGVCGQTAQVTTWVRLWWDWQYLNLFARFSDRCLRRIQKTDFHQQ